MSDVAHGLEGVVAFETTIAEPDRDGGALRYRGVDLAELAGRLPFEQVWGLLVDDEPLPGLVPGEPGPLPLRTGDVRVDVQASLPTLAVSLGLQPLLDISASRVRDDLAAVSDALHAFTATAARGEAAQVPKGRVAAATTAAERFLVRWRGEPDPAHVAAVDAYWTSAAEHGMNASTFTARVAASTGADAAACLAAAVGTMSGPLHGGAPSRVLHMLDGVERTGDAGRYVRSVLAAGDRLMGFGHRVYRAEDPRARVLRSTAQRLGAPRYEVAVALEQAALAELRQRRPDRVLATNVEFWAAVVLDFAEVPPELFTAMFTCARSAGWSAHVLEQKRTGRLIRPSARYAGRGPRPAPALPARPGASDSMST